MTLTLVDLDHAIAAAVQGEIHEDARTDGATPRRDAETDSELVANNTLALLQRIAGTSLEDLDRLICEVQTLRDILQEQGERVQRELAEYTHLSQLAMASTKVIAESLVQWKKVGN